MVSTAPGHPRGDHQGRLAQHTNHLLRGLRILHRANSFAVQPPGPLRGRGPLPQGDEQGSPEPGLPASPHRGSSACEAGSGCAASPGPPARERSRQHQHRVGCRCRKIRRFRAAPVPRRPADRPSPPTRSTDRGCGPPASEGREADPGPRPPRGEPRGLLRSNRDPPRSCPGARKEGGRPFPPWEPAAGRRSGERNASAPDRCRQTRRQTHRRVPSSVVLWWLRWPAAMSVSYTGHSVALTL